MKFRVHIEATAAVGLEFEVDAESKMQAEEDVKDLIKNKKIDPNIIVDELIKPSVEETSGYSQSSSVPLKYATVELDEYGFEVVDTFDVDDING